ncbi:MAG: diadenylate cyclase CdaA [Planctomycetota bacterium]|jgi:diadenylate cyclase
MIRGIIDYLRSLSITEAYPPWIIAIELCLIGIVVYAVLRFLHGTRGARLLQGILVLLIVGFLAVRVLAEHLLLERIDVLYQSFVWMVLLTTLVVFQPELRRGLMHIGGTGFRRIRQSDIDKIARPIASACTQLSKNKIGSLIAVERDIGLSGLVDQGVKVDARLSSDLLNTIFWPGSALHDMGVVIQQGRIAAAGCPFPLGDAEGYDRSIGSRHRAAIGLSLDSDAVVVVVSEETGAISIAVRGRLYRHIPPDALFNTLRRHLASPRGMARQAGKSVRGKVLSPPDENTQPSDDEGKDKFHSEKLESTDQQPSQPDKASKAAL